MGFRADFFQAERKKIVREKRKRNESKQVVKKENDKALAGLRPLQALHTRGPQSSTGLVV